MPTFLFLMLKQQNTKREKNNSLLRVLTEKKVALIGINLYNVLFLFWFIQFLKIKNKNICRQFYQ